MKSWLVNRDPYVGLLYSPFNCVGFHPLYTYMGVSKNRGTPKWIVYNGKPY